METRKQDVFRCRHCGTVIEVLSPGAAMSCCGEPMELLQENSIDASKEKHLPVIVENGSGTLVRIGAEPHPMTPDHYIEWIEIINGGYLNRYHLKPGELPQAAFYVPMQPNLIVRAYCNRHGLWRLNNNKGVSK